MRRPTASPKSSDPLILDIERVAHGGICVAHAPDGRVVFVRHTLPGERVRVAITEERRTYLRADAVEVLTPSPARVTPPCPYAGPGRCGGCDWQHVTLDEQRRLKAAVVREQLAHLAGIEVDVTVDALPGDDDAGGLRWRTRLRLAVDDAGVVGLRRHRSHEVEAIDDCLIAAAGIDVPDVVAREWSPGSEVGVEITSTGQRAVFAGHPDASVDEVVGDRHFEVPVGGFWQVHRHAAETLTAAVLDLAQPRPTDRAVDLYAGVGLFAAAFEPHVAEVVAVESDARAVRAARHNIAGSVVHARVDAWVRNGVDADLVVLDPPRKGAGRAVVEAIASGRPRRVVYVACDPAALARDIATFRAAGYELAALKAYDLFPMTAHVECVALLQPAGT